MLLYSKGTSLLRHIQLPVLTMTYRRDWKLNNLQAQLVTEKACKDYAARIASQATETSDRYNFTEEGIMCRSRLQ